MLSFATGSGAIDATETGEVAQQIVKEPGAAMDTDRWGAILQVLLHKPNVVAVRT